MIKAFLSIYRPSFAQSIVYMLQATEYKIVPYLQWFWRTNDFRAVMYRRTLVATNRAERIKRLLQSCIAAQVLVGAGVIFYGLSSSDASAVYAGLAAIIAAPILWAHLIIIPITVAQLLVVKPREEKLVREMAGVFANFQGPIIAVAGSYGKTTMKELLATILAEGLQVAATPANKNVTTSHAEFASRLSGKEKVLIMELGEGKPGDVARFAAYIHSTHAVITGLAPAHLDTYKTLDAAARDIFSIAKTVDQVYVNAEPLAVQPYLAPSYVQYTNKEVADWQIKDTEVGFEGMSFVMQKHRKKLTLQTKMIGEHLLGPISAAVAIAIDLGLSDDEIKRGVAKTLPYEHRMQPYQLRGGWVIDDSYNGNIEGVRAGIVLLAKLPAARRIYVTPGLVDQGSETHAIHMEIGMLLAKASPDMVVLMNNSATQIIKMSLQEHGFQGEIREESEPLQFYTHLDQFIAKGDVVMLQNDWTDNYA